MSLWMCLFVAISLSMDAFSLSMLYGTLSLSKRVIRFLSMTVGIFHFFMPLFGYLFGDMISLVFIFNAKLLVGAIFILLSIQMLLSLNKTEELSEISSLFSYLLFGFTVSIDSFTVGIGIGGLKSNIWFPCIIFSLVSFLFTFLGLSLGRKLASKFGKYSTILGSLMLMILGFSYLV